MSNGTIKLVTVSEDYLNALEAIRENWTATQNDRHYQVTEPNKLQKPECPTKSMKRSLRDLRRLLRYDRCAITNLYGLVSRDGALIYDHKGLVIPSGGTYTHIYPNKFEKTQYICRAIEKMIWLSAARQLTRRERDAPPNTVTEANAISELNKQISAIKSRDGKTEPVVCLYASPGGPAWRLAKKIENFKLIPSSFKQEPNLLIGLPRPIALGVDLRFFSKDNSESQGLLVYSDCVAVVRVDLERELDES